MFQRVLSVCETNGELSSSVSLPANMVPFYMLTGNDVFVQSCYAGIIFL